MSKFDSEFNANGTILAASTYNGTQTGAVVDNPSCSGGVIILGVSSVTPSVNETQNVLIDATGGTFTLSYGGYTTSPIAYNADPGTVESALGALTSIGVGNVSCAGSPTNINVAFQNALGGQDVAEMTADPGSLTGGAQTATVTTTTPGSSGSSITLTISGVEYLSGTGYTILTGATVTSPGLYTYKVHPALTAASNSVANDFLPRSWKVTVVDNNSKDTTYQVTYSLVV